MRKAMGNRQQAAGPGPHPTALAAARGRAGYTGVEGIDALIPNGVTYDTQIMVQGDTGIGKSVLAAQFLYEGLLVGDSCVYVACDEPPSFMRENMANLRLGSVAYERSGQLVFVDAYSRERSHERHSIPDPGNYDEFFLYQKRLLDAMGDAPARLVVDSISSVFGPAPSADILEFSGHRLRYLRARKVLTLDVYVGGVMEDRAVSGLSHAYPMIIKMFYLPVAGAMQRYLQLGKMKSGQFSSVQHQFTIDSRTGIVVQRHQV